MTFDTEDRSPEYSYEEFWFDTVYFDNLDEFFATQCLQLECVASEATERLSGLLDATHQIHQTK